MLRLIVNNESNNNDLDYDSQKNLVTANTKKNASITTRKCGLQYDATGGLIISDKDASMIIAAHRRAIKTLIKKFYFIDLKTPMVLTSVTKEALQIIGEIESDLKKLNFVNYHDSKKLYRYVNLLHNFVEKRINLFMETKLITQMSLQSQSAAIIMTSRRKKYFAA